MNLTKINLYEAKTHLSRYLDRLRPGDVLLICKRNVPVAEVRAVPGPRSTPRPVGLAAGELRVPQAFFDPLPDEILSDFDGREEG